MKKATIVNVPSVGYRLVISKEGFSAMLLLEFISSLPTNFPLQTVNNMEENTITVGFLGADPSVVAGAKEYINANI